VVVAANAGTLPAVTSPAKASAMGRYLIAALSRRGVNVLCDVISILFF
jgi:hypothetical protein